MTLFKLHHDKTYNLAFAPSKDSEQPGLSPKLISVCFPHEKSLGSNLPCEPTMKTDQTGQMPMLI